MTRLTTWINIALLDDEPLARQRLHRLVENWSWEVSCPSDAASTLPTLWAWLLVRAERDVFDRVQTSLGLVSPGLGDSSSNHEPTSILVRARLVIEAPTPQEFDRQASERINARPLDIILADVRLPGPESGVAFAARWQAGIQSPVVVMVSAFEDSAVQAFNIDAADCVIKPVRAERLATALCRALTKKATRESAHASWARPLVEAAQRGPGDDSVITVMERGKMMNILVDDIVMFRAELKYTTIHTRHRQYLSETSMSRFARQYEGRFLKVHRGCLIAWAHVDGLWHEQKRKGSGDLIKGRVWYLKMQGLDTRIEISRRLWSVVAERFKINPFIAYRLDYVKIDVNALARPDPLIDGPTAEDVATIEERDLPLDDDVGLNDDEFFKARDTDRDKQDASWSPCPPAPPTLDTSLEPPIDTSGIQ